MMENLRASIVGGSGYTGGELLRLLLGHPNVRVGQVTSERQAGKRATRPHPNLRGRTSLTFSSAEELAPCDVLFTALPHGVVMNRFDQLADIAPVVIDLSADFRLRDPATYALWYREHQAPELLGEAYGPNVDMDRDRVGITWAQFGHLYANFYVFQYTTGISAANTLAEKVLTGGPAAAENYLAFLKAGSSLYPIDALKVAGVDSRLVLLRMRHLGSIGEEPASAASTTAKVISRASSSPLQRYPPIRGRAKSNPSASGLDRISSYRALNSSVFRGTRSKRSGTRFSIVA